LKYPPSNIPEKLIGFHEQNNSSRGYLDDIPEPVLIGDGRQTEISDGEKKQIAGVINRQ